MQQQITSSDDRMFNLMPPTSIGLGGTGYNALQNNPLDVQSDPNTDSKFLEAYRIGKMVTYRHALPHDIQASYSKSDNYCLFHFAQNYNGKKCNSFLANGICEYHWKCLNIMFVVMNNLVLETLDKGTYVPRTELNPVFSTPVGNEVKIMFPIIGSCTNQNTVYVLLHSLFTSTNPDNQGMAMAQGLYSMIFSQSPKAAVVRTSWVGTQSMLFSEYDTKETTLLSISNIPKAISIDENFTIFDTPLLLSFPVSTRLSATFNVAGVANVSLLYFKLNDEHVSRSGLQLQDNSIVTANNVGAFAMKGPIIYAPNKKEFKHDYLQTAFHSVTPRLSGITQSDDFKICISNINKSDLACIVLNSQFKMYNDDL
jgi:hypothetical protein